MCPLPPKITPNAQPRKSQALPKKTAARAAYVLYYVLVLLVVGLGWALWIMAVYAVEHARLQMMPVSCIATSNYVTPPPARHCPRTVLRALLLLGLPLLLLLLPALALMQY
jgi:hypothetical protein